MTTLLLCLLVSAQLYSQAPLGINYQAVIRDNTGNVIANSPVGINLSIHQTTATGIIVYDESFTPTTNAFGLVNLVIGQGTVISGDFALIDWPNDLFFIEISVDETGGTNYTSLGTQQFMSVPYAFHATVADSALYDQVVDEDADPTNELQDISFNNPNLSITQGSTVDLSGLDTDTQLTEAQVDAYVANNGYITSPNDADADPTNELQTLSISGNDITLSDGGGTVTVPDPIVENTGGRSSICSGNTAAGTGWSIYNATTISLTVNTTGCGWGSTPRYFTSIGGSGSHFELVGYTAIYSPSVNGFTIYVKKNDGTNVSPTDAVNGGWYINWTGVGN